MKGRQVVALLLAIACQGATPALSQADKVHRLGVLAESTLIRRMVRTVVLPELARAGFVERGNLSVEVRSGTSEELPGLARELSSKGLDVVLAVGTTAVAAAKAASSTTPIVMFGANPVEEGFSSSLSRPGQNITGVVILSRELDGKRLELLADAVPSARRIAALVPPGPALNRREMSERAAGAGLELLYFEATGPDDYPAAFHSIRAAGVGALIIGARPQFVADATRLAQLAKDASLPTMCQWREMAEEGCYLSYGPSLTNLYKRAAIFVERVLNGTSPRDMPIEQPTQFELVLNVKTAKALSLDVSPAFLARVDDVIE